MVAGREAQFKLVERVEQRRGALEGGLSSRPATLGVMPWGAVSTRGSALASSRSLRRCEKMPGQVGDLPHDTGKLLMWRGQTK